MAARLQEVHPAVVRFPLVLIPAVLGADLLGHLTHRRSLSETARRLMPLAAASAAAAALTSLVARDEVHVDPRARDLLATHRTLNVSAAGLATAMAAWRWRRPRPNGRYLAVGVASVALLGFTAFLGARMVYAYGGRARFKRGQAAAAVRTAAGDMMRGLRHAHTPAPIADS